MQFYSRPEQVFSFRLKRVGFTSLINMNHFLCLIAVCVCLPCLATTTTTANTDEDVDSAEVPPADPVVSLQPHEDGRCRCVCPVLSSTIQMSNSTTTPKARKENPERQIYVQSVLPNACSCENVVLKKLMQDPKVEQETTMLQLQQKFCPRCTCKYETRNTTVIKVVVIFILCVMGFLFLYMGFLLCLYPWQKRGKALYHEHRNDEVSGDHSAAARCLAADEPGLDPTNVMVMRANPGSVLHRVGHQQTKWQRTVQEQRRNIYDKHSMLN